MVVDDDSIINYRESDDKNKRESKRERDCNIENLVYINMRWRHNKEINNRNSMYY